MYCPNCGKASENEAHKFCPECGAALNVTETEKVEEVTEIVEAEIAEVPKAKADAPAVRPLSTSCKWTIALMIVSGVMLVVQIILSACGMGCMPSDPMTDAEVLGALYPIIVGLIFVCVSAASLQIPAIIALVNGIRLRQRKWRKIAIIGLVVCVVVPVVSCMIYYGFAVGSLIKSFL